ncbi:unnamed protein product [Peronospora belbahrii]|uniref:Protein kinase domain-containing protein n=1 Tax=Peronospora belbahrii TaxID=622444 RepID=A0ABN8D8F5_9STRA|nr:unnamed protein product [Peronospora belbahrii]
MEDCVTIGTSGAKRRVCEAKHGIYEYVEEQQTFSTSCEHKMVFPISLKGWLWRREGRGIFHYYRRRFCVFQAQQAQFYVYSNDEHDTLLRHMKLARVTLTNRAENSLLIQGYVQDEKERVDIKGQIDDVTRDIVLEEQDDDVVYKLKEEKFKAVSAKACSVWIHCFKYHMKSYAFRRQKIKQEKQGEENGGSMERMIEETILQEMIMDPDFVFEDATKSKRRPTRFVSSYRGSFGSGLFSTSRPRSKSRQEVRKTESLDRSVCEARKLVSHQVPCDQDIVTNRLTVEEEVARTIAAKSLQKFEEKPVEKQASVSISDLPCVSSIWEDEELLSHCVDFDAIIKKEKLTAGACGEVWRAIYRSQEVVIKGLVERVMASAKSPTSFSGSDISAVYRRRCAILDFIEEIRIMSRLEHHRIVEFRGVALSYERDIFLVMEYLPRGDLKTFLGAMRRKCDNSMGLNGGFQSVWTWTRHQWRLAIDIIEGLVYLHSLSPSLVHGDIKSANVLLRDNVRAKLADFGLSRYLSSDEDKDANLAGKGTSSAKMSDYGTRAYGTGRWMAPELIKCGAQTSIASDVYAFGIVLSEIDTCELPFHEREKAGTRSSFTSTNESTNNDSNVRSMNESTLVHRIVTNGWKPSFRVTCPDAIKKLAHDCVLPDPSKRPTSLAVAHRLRQAAMKRERPETLAAQAKAITSLHIH